MFYMKPSKVINRTLVRLALLTGALLAPLSLGAKPPFEVVGYLPDYDYSGPIPSEGNIDLSNNSAFPWANLTQLHVGFMVPDGTGNIVEVSGSTQRAGTVNYGHLNSTKVILTIGGATNGVSNADLRAKWEASVATPAKITAFVANIMSVVNANNFDGVDIDWEFPTGADQTNFMSFMSALGTALHATTMSCGGCVFQGKTRQLSFFISTGYDICGVDWNNIGTSVDYGIYGGYDFNPTGYNGPVSDVNSYSDCRPVARQACITDTVQTLTNGFNAGYYFPKAKMILACPLYSQQPNPGGTSIIPIIRYGTHVGFHTPQDEDEWTYPAGSGIENYIDTQQSFCDKVSYAIGYGMAGIGVWEIGLAYPATDAEVAPIWQTIGGLASCDNSVPTPTAGPTPNLPQANIIDTFEDGDPGNTNLWTGVWSAQSGGTGNTVSTITYPSPGYPASPWGGAHSLSETVTYGGTNVPYLQTTLIASGTKNISAYNRVDFWFQGTPGLYRVQFDTSATDACGYAHYGSDFQVTSPGWQYVSIYFTDMRRPTWAPTGCNPAFASALTSTVAIDWEPVNPGTYTFGLDDVELYTDSVTPTITPTPPANLLDTFEQDGPGAPNPPIDDFGGEWTTYCNPAIGTISPVNTAAAGYPFSSWGGLYSGYVYGTNTAAYGGAFQGWLATGSATTDTHNLSAYNTVQFEVMASNSTATGATGTYGLTVVSTGTSSYSLTTFTVPNDNAWHTVQIPFAQWSGVNWAAASCLYWTSGSVGAYFIDLDDIQFLDVPPTPTPTATSTSTASPSATVSPTPSFSPSGSPTPSSTPSASQSPSPSASPSPTLTGSPSATPTASKTPSPTFSVSPTATPSITPPPPGSTDTATVTISPTWSPSPANTASGTATPTLTPVPPTATPTESPTFTPAPPTLTGTLTDTPLPGTPTLSSTPPPSGTPSPLPSGTASPQASDTPSPLPSGTTSPQASNTASPLPTATQTPQPSGTATPTAMQTNTPPPPGSTSTNTPVQTATPVPTATAAPAGASKGTPAPVDGTLQILKGAAVPNPDPSSLSLLISGPCDTIEIRVYSVSMARVDAGITVPVSTEGGWVQAPLPPAFLAGLPKGAYFYAATALRGSLKSLKPFVGTMVWLK